MTASYRWAIVAIGTMFSPAIFLEPLSDTMFRGVAPTAVAFPPLARRQAVPA